MSRHYPDFIEIYALTAPESDEIRYIGKANDSVKRLRSHIRASKDRKTPVYCWIRKLAVENKQPQIHILERVPVNQWQEAERRLIAAHKSPRLLNVAEGGNEPYCPPEVQLANGRKNAKAIHSDPARKRWWNLTHSISVDLARYKKPGSYMSESHYKRAVLNCMALADLVPKKVPPAWYSIRWNPEELGELNLNITKQYMSRTLFERLDFTGVYE